VKQQSFCCLIQHHVAFVTPALGPTLRSRSRRINCATNLHYGTPRDNVPAPPINLVGCHVIALIESSTRKKLVRATSCANQVRHLVRAFFRSTRDKKHQRNDSSYQHDLILSVQLFTLSKPAPNCPLGRINAIRTAIRRAIVAR
jgi:hypothetical protein